MEVTALTCYMDTLNSYRLVENALRGNSSKCAITLNIKDLLESNPRVSLFHIFLEENDVVDALARKGARSVELYTTLAFSLDEVQQHHFL